MLSKTHILTALSSWISQRPGLDFANYGDVPAYRADLRQITKDRHDAERLLNFVALRESITAEMLLAAFPRGYSGRLSISEATNKRGEVSARLEYCTGQYWPTEYRKAACAVLAAAIWDWQRSNMPPSQGKVTRVTGVGAFARETEHESIEGLSPGDWLRAKFRREFGRRIQARWFD